MRRRDFVKLTAAATGATLFPGALYGRTRADAALVYCESEMFSDLGGWVIDQQAMQAMGYSYVMAHGMGTPVADAVHQVTFPAPGEYRLWVRTRDWVAPWKHADTMDTIKATGTPGLFEVLVDGTPASVTFGTEGEEWHWQNGGLVTVSETAVSIALHDLTGFNGRCEALLFAADHDFVPPNDRTELESFKQAHLDLPAPAQEGPFDVVVVGGGMAGLCAAIGSARLGHTTALIHDRPVVGGNNSSEIGVPLQGATNADPYPEIGNLVNELNGDDAHKDALLTAESRLQVFKPLHVHSVTASGGSMVSVIARDVVTQQEHVFEGTLFVDATGDATIGRLAGADWRTGRESQTETGESKAPSVADNMVMGGTLHWKASNRGQAVPFGPLPWALPITAATCISSAESAWNWETGFYHDMVEKIEYIRDYKLRVIYGNWAYLKSAGSYPNHAFDYVNYVFGKRESNRLMGDIVLTQQDILGNVQYDDAAVYSSWGIDIHYPLPTNTAYFPGEEFRAASDHANKRNQPYHIPYRCLYSRNVANLFMAGRNISVTHVALGQVRVMKTCGMMGEVVALAAHVCLDRGCLPRTVYTSHLDTLKNELALGIGERATGVRRRAPAPSARGMAPDGAKSYDLRGRQVRIRGTRARPGRHAQGVTVTTGASDLHLGQ